MRSYLIRIQFNAEAWAAWVASPHSCRAKVEAAAESFGGRLAAYWWAAGDIDTLVIVEMPSVGALQSLSAYMRSKGGFAQFSTTTLLSDEEAVESLAAARPQS